jgi:hypothetical protein
MSSLSSSPAAVAEQTLLPCPNKSIVSSRNTMTASSTNFDESNPKGNVDYLEDVERDSIAKAVKIANMGRVELTEEDVRFHPRIN